MLVFRLMIGGGGGGYSLLLQEQVPGAPGCRVCGAPPAGSGTVRSEAALSEARTSLLQDLLLVGWVPSQKDGLSVCT